MAKKASASSADKEWSAANTTIEWIVIALSPNDLRKVMQSGDAQMALEYSDPIRRQLSRLSGNRQMQLAWFYSYQGTWSNVEDCLRGQLDRLQSRLVDAVGGNNLRSPHVEYEHDATVGCLCMAVIPSDPLPLSRDDLERFLIQTRALLEQSFGDSVLSVPDVVRNKRASRTKAGKKGGMQHDIPLQTSADQLLEAYLNLPTDQAETFRRGIGARLSDSQLCELLKGVPYGTLESAFSLTGEFFSDKAQRFRVEAGRSPELPSLAPPQSDLSPEAEAVLAAVRELDTLATSEAMPVIEGLTRLMEGIRLFATKVIRPVLKSTPAGQVSEAGKAAMGLFGRVLGEGTAVRRWCARVMGEKKDKVKSPEAIEFGQRLKNAREAKGLSTRELAELTGMMQPAIVRYETGRSLPWRDQIERLAKAVGVSASDLDPGTGRK